MSPVWYRQPAFYFSNPAAICGPDDEISFPARSSAWDYELEVAALVDTPIVNLPEERGEEAAAFEPNFRSAHEVILRARADLLYLNLPAPHATSAGAEARGDWRECARARTGG